MQTHGIHRTCGYLTSAGSWGTNGVVSSIKYIQKDEDMTEQEWKTKQNFTDEEWKKFCEEEQAEDFISDAEVYTNWTTTAW